MYLAECPLPFLPLVVIMHADTEAKTNLSPVVTMQSMNGQALQIEGGKLKHTPKE